MASASMVISTMFPTTIPPFPREPSAVDPNVSPRRRGVLFDLATHIEWTEFYGADALIVSGRMTGSAPDIERVREAKRFATRPHSDRQRHEYGKCRRVSAI